MFAKKHGEEHTIDVAFQCMTCVKLREHKSHTVSTEKDPLSLYRRRPCGRVVNLHVTAADARSSVQPEHPYVIFKNGSLSTPTHMMTGNNVQTSLNSFSTMYKV